MDSHDNLNSDEIIKIQGILNETEDKNSHDVFISYSSKNKNVADAIVSNFEINGIKCWYAPRDILPGLEWVTAISKGISGAKIFLLVYTDDSNVSKQVWNEVALAFNGGKTIVPFKLSNTEMSEELEYYLARVHWLEAISNPLNKNIEQLREYISVILQKQPAEQKKSVNKTGSSVGNSESKTAKKKLPIVPILAAAVLVLVIILAFVLGKSSGNTDSGKDPESTGKLAQNNQKNETENDVDKQITAENEQVTVSPTAEAQIDPQEESKDKDQEENKAEPENKDEKKLGLGGAIANNHAGETWDDNARMAALSTEECFGTNYKREDISSITFMSSIPEKTTKGLDVSVNGDGSVLAWFDQNGGGLYDLTLAADGKIRAPEDCAYLFAGYTHLVSFEINDTFDTSNTKNMMGMFANCSSVKNLDLTGLNTSNVTDMHLIFFNDSALVKLNVAGFDTSKATKMSEMFCNCKSLEELDVSGFDTSQNLTFWMMFAECESLKSINVRNFDTSKSTTFGCMFYNCKSLEELDVRYFDTGNATSMYCMFNKCNKIKKLDVSYFDTSKVKTMDSMFSGCYALEEIKLDPVKFNTSNVENMGYMFLCCYNLKAVDVSHFDTSNVTTLTCMFNSCSLLTELNMSSFDFSKVEKAENMFNGAPQMKVYVNKSQAGWEAFYEKVKDCQNVTFEDKTA